ncbi:MAG: translation initiation factor IF-2 subunit gamma [Methanocellales archaeon]|nr:translation initiation factor IF-2 subunit gamma [Methanocellales archaeon]MDD3292299.1 translation initiation factor IF-2 subunit gamma [Methanocellales archaeon]MDD5235591.1 translation initiation factor IF-2 subunit gamma [Methanocellales archaeon]MDD5485762.1 translation initiation factor IF-2 subunit gamma [Methanocellales archaeon]
MKQPSVNIGIVGHVDHGKTTLVSALSGVWTDRHSEELKRGISIRLGYADITFRKCPNCEEPKCYSIEKKCPHCGSDTNEIRTVSFVDSPGHETLMATMLSGAAIMDGAVLVIAASEPCPQPQTKEHLMALDIIEVKNVVIAQNKIDIVSREDVLKHYHQIKKFVKGTVAENAPIVPISAQHKANIDVLIKVIEETIPTPVHDLNKPAHMSIARSFDVNKPGVTPNKIMGGIIGGVLNQGLLRVGDQIEIKPGRKVDFEGKISWVPIRTQITKIMAGGQSVKEAIPGGLLGVGTKLDPSMTKSDALVGQVAGHLDSLPPVWEEFAMSVKLLDRVVGSQEESDVEPIRTSELLMLSIGTATTIGVVSSARNNEMDVKLKRPVCAQPASRVAISRRIGARWRLIGVGVLL